MAEEKDVLAEAKGDLEQIYEATLRIFEVPFDEESKKPLPRDEPLSQEEFERVNGRVKKRVNELQKKSREIYDELQMTPEELAAFIENPNNFTPEEWAILEEMRAQLDQYRNSIVETLTTSNPEGVQTLKKKKKKKSKSYLKKMRGSQRLSG